MRPIRWIRERLNPTARLGYGIAGAVLLVLPLVVAYRDGVVALRPEAAIVALFGAGYLVAAAYGGRLAS